MDLLRKCLNTPKRNRYAYCINSPQTTIAYYINAHARTLTTTAATTTATTTRYFNWTRTYCSDTDTTAASYI